MKKRLMIAILVLLMLVVFGHVASANAPVPDPYAAWVDYQNVPEESILTIRTTDGEELYQMIVRTSSGRMTISNGTEADFYVLLTRADGTTVQSEPVRFESRSYFRFDGETGVLERGSYLKEEGSSVTWIVLIFGGAAVLLALGVTIVVELLVGLAFRLRRIYRVVIINLFTNPIMNFLLLFLTLSATGKAIYWIVLVILELLVCGVEFWFYAVKYKDRKKWVLLLFTLTANAASAAAGILPVWLIFR